MNLYKLYRLDFWWTKHIVWLSTAFFEWNNFFRFCSIFVPFGKLIVVIVFYRAKCVLKHLLVTCCTKKCQKYLTNWTIFLNALRRTSNTALFGTNVLENFASHRNFSNTPLNMYDYPESVLCCSYVKWKAN